jgi:hypothetical protein
LTRRSCARAAFVACAANAHLLAPPPAADHEENAQPACTPPCATVRRVTSNVQDAMLREFQEEIARLKAALADAGEGAVESYVDENGQVQQRLVQEQVVENVVEVEKEVEKVAARRPQGVQPRARWPPTDKQTRCACIARRQVVEVEKLVEVEKIEEVEKIVEGAHIASVASRHPLHRLSSLRQLRLRGCVRSRKGGRGGEGSRARGRGGGGEGSGGDR